MAAVTSCENALYQVYSCPILIYWSASYCGVIYEISRGVNASENQGKVVKAFKWQVEGTLTVENLGQGIFKIFDHRV